MSRLKVIALASLALAGGAWFLNGQGSNSGSIASTPFSGGLVGAAHAQEAEIDISTIEDMVMGDPDAPVTIIEYASYTCPHCASFHANQLKQLKADYVDTGKVKFIFREVYFDRYGLWASAVARCAGPEKFFGITDMIFEGQSEWVRAGAPADIVEELSKIGRIAGVDGEQLDACLRDGEKLQTLVAWYQQNAETHGIESTPSLVIDGKTYSNMAYDDLAEVIEDAL
ncbi:DsbA family protein [Aliishimia ponticola]|uniref:DsbA family protein n=1 Tax=Aliishimia ponticola TaxID=2499833 RepID=A0A4S4NEQ7_9RHOB|nr:DsbA family protein [Aliishimia ponticola]THH36608.1 DsbA family protein [Aliishimia ponticola]